MPSVNENEKHYNIAVAHAQAKQTKDFIVQLIGQNSLPLSDI